MTPQIQAWMDAFRRRHPFQAGHVLEIGAKNVNGTVREYFPDAVSYTGTDLEPGDNVDLVLDNRLLMAHFARNSFDTIIACEVLEHDRQFWRTIYALRGMLKYNGILIITTPTIGFPYHYPHPGDYYRFTRDTYTQFFFTGLDILELVHLDNAAGPQLTLAGAAKRTTHDPFYLLETGAL